MKPLTAAEQERIREVAEEVRRLAGEQYGVEITESDLPSPLDLTPTQYTRQAQTLALARRMVAVESEIAEEERQAREATAKTPQEIEALEENPIGDITDEGELFRLAQGEVAAFEQAERQRRSALNPDISQERDPRKLFDIYKAQQAEAEKKGGKA